MTSSDLTLTLQMLVPEGLRAKLVIPVTNCEPLTHKIYFFKKQQKKNPL